MTTHIQVINEHGEYNTTEIDLYQAETINDLLETLDSTVPQHKRLIQFFKGLEFHVRQEVKQLEQELKTAQTLHKNVTFRPGDSV